MSLPQHPGLTGTNRRQRLWLGNQRHEAGKAFGCLVRVGKLCFIG
jgi:hypothetical protein